MLGVSYAKNLSNSLDIWQVHLMSLSLSLMSRVSPLSLHCHATSISQCWPALQELLIGLHLRRGLNLGKDAFCCP